MPIEVLIVDDSVLMRRMIAKYVEEDARLKVVGFASDGEQAVRMVKELQPDVVTMDVEMPVMDGIGALKRIMRECPVPVIMLSSLTEAGAMATVSALQHGAVDFIHKPSGSMSLDIYKVKAEIHEKIKAAAAVTVSPTAARSLELTRPVATKASLAPHRTIVEQIVAIGSSTGGPQALTSLLGGLPDHFAHPIVVAQHMPALFTASLARRLDQTAAVRVVEAKHEEPVENGTVYLAPGDYHMNVKEENGRYQILLHQRQVPGLHRPSVNELFASVSGLEKLKRHFVILTGMGSDGAEEMAKAKAAGAATTTAEARETCVVYGMPRAAVERGGVDAVVPIGRMASRLVEVCGK